MFKMGRWTLAFVSQMAARSTQQVDSDPNQWCSQGLPQVKSEPGAITVPIRTEALCRRLDPPELPAPHFTRIASRAGPM